MAQARDVSHTGNPRIVLVPFATVSSSPTDIANSGITGDERLFIAEQDGRVRLVHGDGSVRPVPFLDISGRVALGNEMGLLGLTFDPDYDSNGYFYVNYTHFVGNARYTRISRFSVTPDPNVADASSEVIIFSVEQPYANHNAGDLNFGPDGYFYFGLGDGGSGGDPENRAQNPQNFLGKMLRIDLSGATSTTNYLVPADNPFVGDPTTLDEIWALGLRNPWRFTFDVDNGDMLIADVGQNRWEEIDLQSASSPGGENYGWRCYEGNSTYKPIGCLPRDTYNFPIHTYGHSEGGCSITGGLVYRGSQISDLWGHYLFADFCSGQLWSLDGENSWQPALLNTFSGAQFTTFGEDIHGALYLASSSDNVIYRIVEATSTYLPFVTDGAS